MRHDKRKAWLQVTAAVLLGMILTLCIGLAQAATVRDEQLKGERMYGSPIYAVWLGILEQDPDPPTEGVYVYISTSNLSALQVMDASSNIFLIPLSTPYGNQKPVAYSIPIFDSNTQMAMSLGDSQLTPLYEVPLVGAVPVRMPNGTPFKGDAVIVESLATLTAPDTSTVTQARLSFSKVPKLLAEVTAVDLNTLVKSVLFTPDSGEVWLVDFTNIREPSGPVTTARFGFGSAAATDWSISRVHTDLTGATKFTRVVPRDGAEVTTNANPFGLTCTLVEGSALTVTVEVWGHRLS